MRRRRQPAVPAPLVDEIGVALVAVDAARARLDGVLAGPAPRAARREAHAGLGRALDRADSLLRVATRAAKQHSRGEWMAWRSRLSRLDTARQLHLLAERDDSGLLPIGSVRAVDTGMSGPDIGELQHGRSRAPGAPATYGLDLERVLTDLEAEPAAAPTPAPEPRGRPVTPRPLPSPGTPATPDRAA